MPELSVDFGLFIAYVVPGFIALLGLSFAVAPFHILLEEASSGKDRLGAAFTVLCFTVVAGMTVSVWRAGTIDQTFRIPLPWICTPSAPQACAVLREDPDFAKLTKEGNRAAFLLAERSDKRPYQFYGNVLIATFVVSTMWLFKQRTDFRHRRTTFLFVIVGTVFVMITLYSAARLSHFRFMTAVHALNKTVQ